MIALPPITLFTILFTFLAEASSENVKIWNSNYGYPINLLREAAPKSIRLRPSIEVRQTELLGELISGKNIHIGMFPPTEEFESNLIPIYVPVMRGILGMRICLINPKFQNLFKNIKSISDMRKNKIEILGGVGWPDNDVYRHAKLEVRTTKNFRDLYALLDTKTPRCFSRSIGEVTKELEEIADLNIIAEPTILLQYDLPSMYFVSPKKVEFAKDLEEGLSKLLKSGKFLDIFWRYHNSLFSDYNVMNRTVVYFENPNLSDKVKQMIDSGNIWLPKVLKNKIKSNKN